MPLTIPTIHTNGTSREQLMEQIWEANNALGAAIKALETASPNDRDYYPQGADAGKKARQEHQSRIDRIASVRKELSEIFEAIDA